VVVFVCWGAAPPNLGSEVLLALLEITQYRSVPPEWLGKMYTFGIALVVRLTSSTSTSYAIHRLTALLCAVLQPIQSIGSTIDELRSLAAFAGI
jgi:hypothetical protein